MFNAWWSNTGSGPARCRAVNGGTEVALERLMLTHAEAP
jgi:hypothetical protein